MNIEVEFFKQQEKKLVVLRKIHGEDRVVDFDASIIYEDEYDSVFKDLSKRNRQIERNYKEYLGDIYWLNWTVWCILGILV